MLPVVTAAEMKRCDAAAIDAGTPALRMMERAATGALAVLRAEFGSLRGARILFLCGPGNNGGDALAMARLAKRAGALTTIALATASAALKNEAATNYRRAVRTRIRCVENAGPAMLEDGAWNFIVDGLLGTGARLPLPAAMRMLLRAANAHAARRVALDLPTGVSAEGDCDSTVAFHADTTATFGAIKLGVLFGEGRRHAGRVHVVPIGVPDESLDAQLFATRMLQRDDIVARFPSRAVDANKYSAGKLFLLCGAPGMAGAGVMASGAAMRIGAGITVLGVPRGLVHALTGRFTETMLAALPENADGCLDDAALDMLGPRIEWATACVVGCGISKDEGTAQTVRAAIERARCPIVLDADGLAAFTTHHDALRNARAPIVLTPHVAELARLMNVQRDAVTRDPLAHARSAAQALQCIVVLKGGPTVIATPASIAFVNPTGNPGMATAGAGDVLSGMIGGLLAQGCAPLDAAIAGVYLHGVAGDIAAAAHTEPGMIASDIISAIPDALRFLPVESVGARFRLPQ